MYLYVLDNEDNIIFEFIFILPPIIIYFILDFFIIIQTLQYIQTWLKYRYFFKFQKRLWIKKNMNIIVQEKRMKWRKWNNLFQINKYIYNYINFAFNKKINKNYSKN